MPSLSKFLADNRGLSEKEADWLQHLIGDWNLLSDLLRADHRRPPKLERLIPQRSIRIMHHTRPNPTPVSSHPELKVILPERLTPLMPIRHTTMLLFPR